jgi:hypothetical protein
MFNKIGLCIGLKITFLKPMMVESTYIISLGGRPLGVEVQ